MIRYWLTFLLVLGFFYSSQAQTDYLVTLQGDTLFGEIKLITGPKVDRLQLITEGEKSNYSALQARAIRMEGQVYHAIPLGDNLHYMQLLKVGSMSIYGYRIENQATYDGRLLRKSTGASFDVPTIKFRSSIANFIEECDTVSQTVRGRKMSREDLEEIVAMYNDCMADKLKEREKVQQEILTREQKKTKLESFRQQIADSSLDKKDEIVGLLSDMIQKIASEQSIPAYQKSALQDYLGGTTEFRDSLTQLLQMLD